MIVVGQLYVPLQYHDRPLITDMDEIIDGHRLVVKDCKVVSWEPVQE